jgi:hypothetical protein
MKILRTTDIITLKHEELEVDFSPLRHDKAIEISNLVKVNSGKTVVDAHGQMLLTIKYAVKEIRGVTNWNDEPIVIKSINGELTDNDASDAINALARTPFISPISYISASALPKAYEGVEILVNGKEIDLGND